jgi:hypothetical protein
MSEQTVVDLESALQRRSFNRGVSDTQLKKAELRDIMASEALILATATGEVIVRALERRERMKERRFLAIMLIGIAALIGLARYMMQLVMS